MKDYTLYDSVRSLTNISDIEDIELACRMAKQDIFRKRIEEAVKAAQDAGYTVIIERENGTEVQDIVIHTATEPADWGIYLR